MVDAASRLATAVAEELSPSSPPASSPLANGATPHGHGPGEEGDWHDKQGSGNVYRIAALAAPETTGGPGDHLPAANGVGAAHLNGAGKFSPGMVPARDVKAHCRRRGIS